MSTLYTNGQHSEPSEGPITRVVAGQPPRANKIEGCTLADDLINEIAAHWATITHLHLWGVHNLNSLLDAVGNNWPPDLRVLDLRASKLDQLGQLPATLEELDIAFCENITTLPTNACPTLRRLYIDHCPQLQDKDHAIGRFLAGCTSLEEFSATNCTQLQQLWLPNQPTEAPHSETWHHPDFPPYRLYKLVLEGCTALQQLPDLTSYPWLHHLNLKNCTSLSALSDLPERAQYIDLGRTRALRRTPKFLGTPRTLFLYGSALEWPDEILSKDEEDNVAPHVLAHLGEANLVVDNEIKVILLGDGRAGKSSLARRFVKNGFSDHEPSTHGVRLWTKTLPFTSADGAEETVTLKIWDFAGQDLYHNSHRLFFQSKAVFLLCGNCCPDGADKTTDELERASPHTFDDIRRTMAYWKDQVASLSDVDRGGTPPMAVLRTKEDRDDEDPNYKTRFYQENAEALEGMEVFDVSSKREDDPGMAEMLVWLQAKASEVLGPRGKREMGARLLDIKNHLEERMRDTDTVHA